MKPLSCLVLCFASLLAGAADVPKGRNNFVVIAHRGNHARAHENTLTALQYAIDGGADYAEIDVRRTVDGHYVLMHDRDVDRMTGGHGPVSQLTLAQIRELRVRDIKRPQIPRDRVPTFEEALGLIKGRINIYLDFKEGDRAAVAGVIRGIGAAHQILIYDGLDWVGEWHRVAPELPLIVSPPDDLKTPQQLVDFARRHGIEVLDGNWKTYSREMVEAANRAGVQIWPDIQAAHEDSDYFKKVLDFGFSGVQTDHPEALINWLKQNKLH